jgi:heparan-alpha-glucosaminide N-acetyltransferase
MPRRTISSCHELLLLDCSDRRALLVNVAQPCDISVSDGALAPVRLVSLDAYRGLVMMLMASEGLRLADVARHFPGSRMWQALARQSDHVRWEGCTLWDLIMPAFLLIVGVAIPFSLASRRRRGQGFWRIAAHAVWRSAILVLLGIFIMSNGAAQTNFSFINVLAQIGLGYWLVVLLAECGWQTQVTAIICILVGDWWWFYHFPLPGNTFDFASVGVPAGWHHPEGIAAHWDLNANPAAAFDRWFLNLFPRQAPFRFREGGGTTLNFVPAVATMLLGVLAGNWLRSGRGEEQIVRGLLVSGAALLAAGMALDPAILPGVESMRFSLCPIIKRLWTPSYVLYSGGWVILGMAALYWLIDVLRVRQWAFPFVVVGMNSLVMYLLAALADGWMRRSLNTHFGVLFSGTYGPIFESIAVLALFWLICWWLYRRGIFVRI